MDRAFTRRAVLGGGAGALAAPLIIGRRASAAERSITMGVYFGQQTEVLKKQIIPAFEAKHQCKVYTTQGVTLEQVALLRASRSNPKYSVMFIDDPGVELAKREGLIEKLPRDEIPNMARLLDRCVLYDGYGAGFALSATGFAYNTATGQPLTSYADLWDPKYKGRILLIGPKSTQSIFMPIGTVAVVTGKPFKEAQYLLDQAWPKMEQLKPNVLSMFQSETVVMQIASGDADIAGLFHSKQVYPYTAKGVPVDVCYPREGTGAIINSLTLVKNGPERELAVAFIDWMLSPEIQKLLAEQTLTAPTISGLDFPPEIAKYMAYPESKMAEMGIFIPDWSFINPQRADLVEKYNQVFGT